MKKAQRGFGLIEVLVTIVLTAIGILGVVAMQGKSIQFTQQAVNQNTAALLAADLMETLRASRHELYDANIKLKPDSDYFKSKGSDFASAEAGCSDTNTECPLAQLQAWKTRVQQQLPGVTENLLKDEYSICISKEDEGCSEAGEEGVEGSAIEIRLAWTGSFQECIPEAEDADKENVVCYYTLRAEI